MKRILWLGLMLIWGVTGLTGLKVYAEGESDPLWNRPRYEKKITQVGHRLLEMNHITEHVSFELVNNDDYYNNAVASDDAASVKVHRQLLRVVENDDELAFILGHEIGHILKRHGLKKGLVNAFVGSAIGALAAPNALQLGEYMERGRAQTAAQTRNFMNGQELQADIIGVDLMVGAGYNPWAGYRMAEKIFGDGYLLRIMRSHPNAKTRLTNMATHITTRFPQYPRLPEVSQPLATPDTTKPAPFYIQD